MIILYAVCDAYPTYYITFSHTFTIHYPGLFTYPVKDLIHKSEYLLQKKSEVGNIRPK